MTGADGFIGSHLVERLLKEGATVRAFVFYNSFNAWGWLDSLPKEVLQNIDVVAGDIRDPFSVGKSIEGMDAVFHLAALIGVPYSYTAPEAYVATNVMGTLNVLEGARRANVTRVLVTSTSEVYGTAQSVPIDERHPLQAQSPYSASKIGADKIAESFQRSFGTPVVIARPFNTFGPRQSARAVIPTIVTQILHGAAEIKMGSLEPTRDFNYVDDICRGLIALAACDEAVGLVVNIGSGQEVSIGALTQRILALTGSSVRVAIDDMRLRPKTSEVDRLCCNATLLKRLTGWQPETSFDDGLRKTIAWFRDGENMRRYKPTFYNR